MDAYLDANRAEPRPPARPTSFRDVLVGIADETLAKRRRAS